VLGILSSVGPKWLAACPLDLLVHTSLDLLVLGRLHDEVVEETVHHVERPFGPIPVHVNNDRLTFRVLILLGMRAEVGDLAEVVEVLGQRRWVPAFLGEGVDLVLEMNCFFPPYFFSRSPRMRRERTTDIRWLVSRIAAASR
jgi:hypothetical protein